MKYVREHMNEKFTQDSDPIKDMGIGDPEKALFPILRKELNLFGIDIFCKEEAEGCWVLQIDFNESFEDDLHEGDYIDLFYFSDNEQAKEYSEYYYEELDEDDYFKAGFNLLSDLNNYIPPTHDYKKVVKALLKINFGDKSQIKTKIQRLQNRVDLYKKILDIK